VSTETTYTYQGLTLLALSATQSTGATYTLTYFADESGRPWAATYAGSDAATPVMIQLVTTDRGDVVELLDASGNAFATYRYDAWGSPIASGTQTRAAGAISAALASSIASGQPLRYAGYGWDAASGLYYCSQRYYDPATFQFISKDTARADGEESAYQYCGGDPISKTDPSGLWASGWRVQDCSARVNFMWTNPLVIRNAINWFCGPAWVNSGDVWVGWHVFVWYSHSSIRSRHTGTGWNQRSCVDAA
jgi:RHS repeat-associated protein